MPKNSTKREQKENFKTKSLGFANIRVKTLKEHVLDGQKEFFFIKFRILDTGQLFRFIKVNDSSIGFLLTFQAILQTL